MLSKNDKKYLKGLLRDFFKPEGDKNCPALIPCEACKWYRYWKLVNEKTGEEKIERKCSIDVLLENIPRIIGAIDGCQAATNQTRNRIEALGRATAEAFQHLDEKVRELKQIEAIEWKSESNEKA
ncbi:MAG: hypothetical protein JRJ29_00515 [Deltaproteobacteria bacterium]|nr:hypothetical protein [Deltaproteobacteria bacterium]MBW2081651.1 hypothetical protein [Deltaproteobacteria bacterium]